MAIIQDRKQGADEKYISTKKTTNSERKCEHSKSTIQVALGLYHSSVLSQMMWSDMPWMKTYFIMWVNGRSPS